MTADPLSTVIIIGLPIVLILLQIWLTRQRLPWMGFIAAIFILVFAVLLLFNANKVIIENCAAGEDCGELGFITAALLLYAYGVLAIITLAGHLTLWYYRNRVWHSAEPGGLWKGVYWLLVAILLVPLALQLVNPLP